MIVIIVLIEVLLEHCFEIYVFGDFFVCVHAEQDVKCAIN